MGFIFNKNTARNLKVFYPGITIKRGKTKSLLEPTVKNKY